MMKDFLFKKLIGRRGLYCKITYEFETLEAEQGAVIFNPIDPWYNEINSGAGYFFDKYIAYNKSGIKLTISEVHGMIVDTTPDAVFYTVVMLLCKETGFVITGLGFDENGGLILSQ